MEALLITIGVGAIVCVYVAALALIIGAWRS